MHHRRLRHPVRWTTLALCAVTGCASAPGRTMYANAPSVTTEAPPPSMPEPPAQPSPSDGAAGATASARTAVAGATGPGAATTHGTSGAEGGTGTTVPAPMLIYIADIDLQTAAVDVVPTLDRVVDLAGTLGGYLVRRTDTSVQVRVPSARFREGLGRVETLGEVLHRSITADDVSEEYRDLEVRLQNLRAVRLRLEGFLSHAANMADALSIERELERVTREIDTLEGRLRFLGTRVAYSLVTVNVRPRPAVMVTPPSPVPGRRLIDLPVEWLSRVGLDRLLQVR